MISESTQYVFNMNRRTAPEEWGACQRIQPSVSIDLSGFTCFMVRSFTEEAIEGPVIIEEFVGEAVG